MTAELSLSTATLGVVLGNLAIALAMIGLLAFQRDINALRWWATAFLLDAGHFALPFFGSALDPRVGDTLSNAFIVGSAVAMLAGVLAAMEQPLRRRGRVMAALAIFAIVAALPALGLGGIGGIVARLALAGIVGGLLVIAGSLLVPGSGPAARGPMRLAAVALLLLGVSRAILVATDHMPIFGPLDLLGAFALNLFAAFALVMLLQRREHMDLRSARDRLAESERRLRESEERFRDIAEASSDWIWEMDADLRFTYLSDRILETSGLHPSQVVGKTRRELSRDDDEHWVSHYADLKARRPFRDFQYSSRDLGKGVRHFRISGKPIYDKRGKFVGYRGTGRDVTDQVVAEASAKDARAKLIEAIESMDEGIALYDHEGRLVRCNSRYKDLFFSGP